MAARKQRDTTGAGVQMGPAEDVVLLEPRYTSGFSKLAVAERLTAWGSRLWHGPTLAVARRVLASYWRTGWLAGECLLALALAALMFWNPGSALSVFTSAATGYGLLALLGGALLATSTGDARVAAPLVRQHGRRVFAQGLMLTAGALRVVLVGGVLVLVCAFHRIASGSVGAILAGAVGLLVICVVLSALAVALSITRGAQTAWSVALALFVLALWSYVDPVPLGGVLVIFRLPLLPLIACYGFGVTGVIGWTGVLALLVAAAYLVALTLFVERRLPASVATAEKRETAETAETLTEADLAGKQGAEAEA